MTTYNVSNATDMINAINSANNSVGPHTILVFSSFGVTTPAEPNDSGGTAFPIIKRDITIEGANNTIQTISRNSATRFRFFNVNNSPPIGVAGAKLTLKNLKLRYGDPAGGGGAVTANSELVIINCQFFNNHAIQYGGAVYSNFAPSLTIDKCVFWENSATSLDGSYGGAVWVAGQLTVTQSIFHNNSVGPLGAGTAEPLTV